jgi:DNA-binding GntR family transcriptional regulator
MRSILSTKGPNDQDLVAVRVERDLEDLILRGEYGPGDRINENALALRLGVSRAPVREACKSLQRDGLLRGVPNQGSFVRTLSLAEIVNLFDVRACLGRLAGELAAALITRSVMDQLRDLMLTMDEASRLADAARYIELNIEFHAALYAASGNIRLAMLDAQMGKELRVYRHHGLAFGGGLAVSNLEHCTILTAIERGDRMSAGVELEKHIQNGRDRFIRAMSATGQLVLSENKMDRQQDNKRRSKRVS